MLDKNIGCCHATLKDHLDQVIVEAKVGDGRPGATDREVGQVVEVAEGLRRRIRKKMEKRRGSGRDGRERRGQNIEENRGERRKKRVELEVK